MEKYTLGASIDTPAILKNIPLEQCSEEIEYISRKRALVAPIDKAFVVRGAFDVMHAAPTFEESYYRPYESKVSCLNNEYCKEQYEKYLLQAGGDANEAWRLMEEEEDTLFLDEFIGKWLSVEVNEQAKLEFIVRAQVYTFVDREIGHAALSRIAQLSKEADLMEKVGFSSYPLNGEDIEFEGALNEVTWRQDYVKIGIDQDDLQVSLIDYDQDKSIVTPKVSEYFNDLLLPKNEGVDSEGYFSYLENELGIKYTDEERVLKARYNRRIGAPFSDDPLRKWVSAVRPQIILPPQQKNEGIIKSVAVLEAEKRIEQYFGGAANIF